MEKDINTTLSIVLILILSGAMGGIASYIRDKTLSISSYIFLGIFAALTVPLFLNLTSSSIIKEIYNEKNSSVMPIYFVLMGFCLIAAYSSGNFLQVLTGRLFANINSKIEKQENEINDLRAKSERLNNNLNTIVTNPISDSVDEQIQKEILQKPENIEILNSIKNDKNLFTPKSELKKDVQIDDDIMDHKIEKLKDNNLIKEIVLNDEGETALAITPVAEEILNNIKE